MLLVGGWWGASGGDIIGEDQSKARWSHKLKTALNLSRCEAGPADGQRSGLALWHSRLGNQREKNCPLGGSR